MPIPPAQRTVNRPAAVVGVRAGAGPKATDEAAPPPVTTVIQKETSRRKAPSTPTPSVKLSILTTPKDIAKWEAAGQAGTAVRTMPPGAAAPNKAYQADGGEDARPPTTAAQALAQKMAGATSPPVKADNGLQSAGPETAAQAAQRMEAGKEPAANQPLGTEKTSSTDDTTPSKAEEKKPVTPPPEPISKKLLDFLQLLWRASGSAVDGVPVARQARNPDPLGAAALTYKDPTAVKKTTGLESPNGLNRRY